MSAMDIGNVVAAIGGLGTASFALVDATKIGKDGGIGHISRKVYAQHVILIRRITLR